MVSLPRRISALVLLGSVVLAGCGDSGEELHGHWQLGASRQGPQRFSFERGGRARWEIGSGPSAEIFELRYRLSKKTQPWSLDLSGFARGPMAGSSMLCIVELPDSRTLALDCWPSSPKNEGLGRPKKLGPTALRFEKSAA